MSYAACLCLALLLAATGLLHAQGAAPPSPAPNTTIQARANLVVVDVVVTDHAGKSVQGLHKSDFVIAENGKQEQIRSFDEHTAPTQPATPEPPVQLPPGVFTNYSPTPNSAALNILLLDTLNTPLRDQGFVRDQLLRYLRSAPPGNRIAIFALTTQLLYLQSFTADPDLLRAAIDTKNLRASPLLGNATSGGGDHEFSTVLKAGNDPELAAAVARVKQLEAKTQAYDIGLRTRYTLNAMNVLAQYLSGLSGRKNLIWFSGAFPVNILPDGNLANPFDFAADFGDQLRETTNLLTRSQVALYPIDARGLFNHPMYDPGERGPANVGDFTEAMTAFNQQTAAEHTTMRTMAEQTGGRAFLNTNGLAQAVHAAVSAGANFYTLTYTPTDTHWDGKYRHITLHLGGAPAQERLTLEYRRGYFAFNPEPPAPPPNRRTLVGGNATVPAATSTSALRAAMMRGAPDATAITFKARILPTAALSVPADPSPGPGTRPNPNPKLATGPWRSYTVDLAAAPGQLLTRAPDNSYSGIAELIVHCYNTDGELVSAASQAVQMKLPPDKVTDAAAGAIPLRQLISVPDHGEFFLRVGLHNLLDNRTGSLEVPLSSIKNLPPAS